MHAVEFQNAIRVNHRGFLKTSQKRFVLLHNQTDSLAFTVFSIRDVEKIPEFTGLMEVSSLSDGSVCYVGDFSSIEEDGDYFIQAGGYTSRQFVIYDRVYDTCLRMMLEFFTWQRCGHDLGWNGKCHTDDGYIFETGEHVDLSGGYHQSCDLRKSPAGLSIGVLAMLRFVMKDSSAWGKHLAVDEAAWACDYFVKTIQGNGAMYNTLSAPFGWEGRVFYQSPAPSSAQWNTTSILATGYLLFKDTDSERANRYLCAAIRSWDFMTGPNRPTGAYQHPAVPPRGMDPDHFYQQCSKNSTADLGYQVQVSCDMYRATGDEKYLTYLRKVLPDFMQNMGHGSLAHLLFWNDSSGRTVMASGSYAWLPGGLIALCDAYELLGNYHNLKNFLQTIADAICTQAETNVWRNLRPLLTDADLDVPNGHPVPGCPPPTLRQSAQDLSYYATTCSGIRCYCRTMEITTISTSSVFGIFLARTAKLLNCSRYLGIAQSVLDQMLGANNLDSSHIRAIGYNHAQHKAFGQFFPSTPFLPGAIGTPYSSIDVYKTQSEYDMPVVGMAMYLISEIIDQ